VAVPTTGRSTGPRSIPSVRASYLVHDVGATVPVVVDAVVMLEAGRIEGLPDAFDDHARYVVASALPAEADHLRSRFDAVDLGPTTRGDASAN
jgi:hypothetical protein